LNDPVDIEEWQRLYKAVRAVCSEHGKEDAFGGGDFWVVDDCWGGVSQKLIVTNPSFLTPELVKKLSACISRLGLLGAEIVVALEGAAKGPAEVGSGLVVHSTGFEEYWDIAALRAKHGDSFFT
jgi:hypothetical protein